MKNVNDNKNIVDISAIGNLSKLSSLNLGGCSSILDLSPIDKLKNIFRLNICGCIVHQRLMRE